MSPEDELKATLSFELGQIRKEPAVLDRMAGSRKHLGPDEVKVRAAASSLHPIYNGIEKMLETVLKSRGQAPTTGPTSHADLPDAVVVAGVIPSDPAVALRNLMAFRHFFRHSYGFMIDHELLNPLIRKAADGRSNQPGVHVAPTRRIRRSACSRHRSHAAGNDAGGDAGLSAALADAASRAPRV